MIDPNALPGARLGRYEIQSLIGSGGMAIVYQGFDHTLQRLVAIKLLSQVAAAQPGLADRFQQEARLIARLHHPHIVQVYDFGEHNGITYMVEELLPGPTLAAQIKDQATRGGHFSREQVLTIAQHLASALDAAHKAGIIHRDVKPGNAIWNANGLLVLTDFGIARQMLSEAKHTQTGMVVGTPDYLSPEQAQGLPLTPASDIYALGVVLYEVLAGKVPFTGETPMRVVIGHIQTPPPPLLTMRPDLPPPVDAVIQRALSKEPTARYSSASELANALHQAWSAAPATIPLPVTNIHEQTTRLWEDAPRQPVPPARPPEPPVSTVPPVPPTPRTARAEPAAAEYAAAGGGRFPVALVAGVLLVLLVLGGIALAMGMSSDTAITATATPLVATAPVLEPSPESAPTSEELPPSPEPAPTDEPTAAPEPTTPPPSGPVPSGQLAFSTGRDGNQQIYVMNADGSGARNVSNSAGNDYAPAWSPGGQQIAFHSSRDGNDEIYVMDADGSNQRRLTENDWHDREPVWSPDGRSMAFWSQPYGNWDIYLMDANGNNRRPLADAYADDFEPAWSPDGSQVAFTSNRDGNDEIYVINADGSGLRNLTSSPANDKLAVWSPDGGALVFMSERDGNAEIYVMDSDGSNQRNLSDSPATEDTQPAWSPDGQFIVFTSDRDGNTEIYIMQRDGSNPRRLTESTAEDWDAAWLQ